jgi:hypothetical protein
LLGHLRERTLNGINPARDRPASDDLEARATIPPDVDNPRAQIELHCHAKRVEPAAQIRGGTGYSNFVIQK